MKKPIRSFKEGELPGTDEIFVFGSNQAGIHGAGAAAAALRYYRAEWGVGEGITGQSYALPTKNHAICSRELEDIKASVDKFVEFANKYPEMEFFITKIGCGLAGFTNEQIAPMFVDAPSNCRVQDDWAEIINALRREAE